MNHKAQTILSTIVAAVLSGIFWLAVLGFAEGFLAADYRPGTEPSAFYLWLKSAVVIIGAPALFALCIAGWRRLERRFIAAGA